MVSDQWSVISGQLRDEKQVKGRQPFPPLLTISLLTLNWFKYRNLAISQSRNLKKVPRARHAGQKKKDRDKREKQVSIYTGVGQKDIK